MHPPLLAPPPRPPQYHLRPRAVRMATYAAYRHVELFNVGHGKKRVLKPPGGGSSDIFGTSSHDPEPQQRKARNHLTSSIFSGDDSQTPARNKAGNSSFYNLFGAEPQSQSRPGTAVKDKFTSNIVLEDVNVDAKKSLFPEVGREAETETGGEAQIEAEAVDGAEVNGVHKPGDVEINSVYSNGVGTEAEEEGNQATTNGEKAEPVMNGSSAPTTASAAPSAASSAAPPSKQRVPPGGFSSGLW